MLKPFVMPATLLLTAVSLAAAQNVNPGLVAACVESQQQAMTAVDAANRRIELARQTNQPAAMRAAMDDLQLALSSMRTQLAPCATLQAAAAPAAQVMANMPGHNMANMAAAPPAGTAAAPAPAAAPSTDPHAGHVMPAAPQAPAAAGSTAGSRPAAAQARPVAPPPHADHVTPSAAPSSSPATPAAGAGHDMANMPGHNMANMGGGASSPEVTVNLPTGPENLSCGTKVDPKTAPRAAYAGKTYYFCSVAERDRFAKDPAAYRPGK